MLKDYFKFAFGNFRHRKMRSWLTMLGIFIGIAAIVSLISLSQGLKSAIEDQFQTLGMDKIIISPGSSLFQLGASASELKEGDLNAVKKVPGVELAGGYIYKIDRTEFKGKVAYTWIIGMPTDETMRLIQETGSFKMRVGRDLKSSDKYKAVVGPLVEKGDVFDKKLALGDSITIGKKEFEVVGIYYPIGNPQDDSQIIIPMETARIVMQEPDKYDMLFVKAASEKDVEAVADRIEKKLRNYRNKEKGNEDFTVQTSQDLLDTYSIILNIVQAVIIGIAAISLFVGGVGIMNTMYTAVLERTKEIGVMKAIGARNSEIMKIFLIESGMLGAAGGLVGIVLGMGFSKLVSIVVSNVLGVDYFRAVFPIYLIAGSLAFSFLVGSLSGLLPAIQASRQKPVDSLRYE